MAINFERESLYEEVWSTPLSRLCKKYSLSDNGLRKACKALAIPLPQRGYWARIAAGQTIQRPPLPSHPGPTEFISRPIPRRPNTLEKSQLDRWVKEGIAFEADPANHILINEKLEWPHPLIVTEEQAIQRAVADIAKSRRVADAPLPRVRGRRTPNPAAGQQRWQPYHRHGLLDVHNGSLPIDVSMEAMPRALRIFDGLLKAAESRHLLYSSGPDRLSFELQGVKVHVRLTEKTERVAKNRAENPFFDFRKFYTKRPTGLLRLHVSSGVNEVKFSDSPNARLESLLNAVISRVYRAAARAIELQVLEAERVKQRAISKERAEIDDKQRSIRREKIRLADERKEVLLQQASAWDQVVVLRRYIAHIESKAAPAGIDGPSLEEWADWAKSIADQMDPSPACMNQMMKQK